MTNSQWSSVVGVEAVGIESASRKFAVFCSTPLTSAWKRGRTVPSWLTPVATAEAMWLARTLFRGEPSPIDHEHVPTAVFAHPNIATVGLSEEKARERYGAIDIYKALFRPLKLTMTEKKERTFMKLVVDRASQRVVGAHMIGLDAGEVIQGIAIAVKLGATKAQFDATLGIHPTVAEEFVTMRDKAL